MSRADGLRVIATCSRLMSRLSGEGATALLDVDVTSQHPIIDLVLPEIRTAPGRFGAEAASIPVITTTGAAPVFDADYWAANLRNPVRFSQAVGDASADHGTFIEVSPHPLLTNAISDTLTRGSSPQHRNPGARHPRHAHLPHQSQHRPHQRAAEHRSSCRATSGHPDHALAPHPPLD